MFIINNYEWDIVFVNPNNDILCRSDGILTFAVTDNNYKKIFISNSIHGNFLKKVLTHELVHCYCISYGLDFTLKDEELCADLIATYGYDILQLTDKILLKSKIG